MMRFTEVELSQEIKAMVGITLVVVAIRHISIVVKATTKATGLHMAKSAKGVAETITSNQCIEVVMLIKNVNLIIQGQRKATRKNVSMR